MRPRLVRPVALAALVVATGAIAAIAPSAAHAAPAGQERLGAEGAVVTRPETVLTRTLSPVQGCQTLLADGTGDCTVVRTEHGDLVVTVEPGRRIDDVLASRPWTVSVYRPSATVPDGWELALATHPEMGESGPLYAQVSARAADVTGDGHDELLLGYRNEGTGMILDVDVVGTEPDGTPRVLAHDEIYKGSVVVRDSQLVAYTPVYKTSDANCCPTWIARDVLRFDDGGFSVERTGRVRTKDARVPPSQLG